MVKNNNNNLMIVLIVILILALFGGYRMIGFGGGVMKGYYGASSLVGILALIAAIWVIYDVLVNNTRLSDGMKIFWVILAVFFSIITAIIYYLVGKNAQNDLFRKRQR